MGMRFRKSFKIAPGVKLNLSKRGIGVSAGVKGARVSLNSKGRVTKSVGIPGTGISYVSSSKLGASKKKATAKKTSAKASTAFAAENPSADTTPTPPVSDNSSPTPGGKMNPKSILRWVIYIAVICIATQISKKLCYPSMFLVGLFHLFQTRKTLADEQKKKKSTIRTCCFLVFTVLGCLVTIPTPNVETIKLTADEDTMDINEEQLISFTYAPKDADASNLLLELSDGTLAKAEQTDDGIVLHTQAKEGTFTLVAKKGSAKSNELTLQVIDKEKAEQERIAAETKAEEERLAAEKAEQERIAARQQSQAQSQNSATVYVTPTGKKYHYNSSCNGGSYSPTTLDNAIKMGLTPCKKCVG